MAIGGNRQVSGQVQLLQSFVKTLGLSALLLGRNRTAGDASAFAIAVASWFWWAASQGGPEQPASAVPSPRAAGRLTQATRRLRNRAWMFERPRSPPSIPEFRRAVLSAVDIVIWTAPRHIGYLRRLHAELRRHLFHPRQHGVVLLRTEIAVMPVIGLGAPVSPAPSLGRLSGEKTAPDRRPGHHAHAFRGPIGHHLALFLAIGQIVEILHGDELLVAPRLLAFRATGDCQAHIDEVGTLAHLAHLDDRLQRPSSISSNSVWDRGLVELRSCRHRSIPRRESDWSIWSNTSLRDIPACVGAGVRRSHPEAYLGRHPISSRLAKVFQRLTGDLLGIAEIVVVGRVEEIDATFHPLLEERLRPSSGSTQGWVAPPGVPSSCSPCISRDTLKPVFPSRT